MVDIPKVLCFCIEFMNKWIKKELWIQHTCYCMSFFPICNNVQLFQKIQKHWIIYLVWMMWSILYKGVTTVLLSLLQQETAWLAWWRAAGGSLWRMELSVTLWNKWLGICFPPVYTKSNFYLKSMSISKSNMFFGSNSFTEPLKLKMLKIKR